MIKEGKKMKNLHQSILQERMKNANLDKLSGPFSVAFTVTNKCNYRCRHCYNNSGQNIYRELTEGVLLDLKNAGINTIQVSLDGNNTFLHENMRLISGAFKKAIEAIRRASEKGFKVAVSFCPNKLNIYKIEETCKLVKELGANDFRVMPLILMGRGKSMVNMKPSPDEYLWLQQKISKLKDLYQDEDFVISWGDPLDHLTRMPENNKNSMNTYSVEIRSDGKLLLCNYLPIVVGDLNKHSLKDYWHAGYNNIWGNNKLQPYISNLYSTEQFSSFCPEPYTGRDIVYDLIDAK